MDDVRCSACPRVSGGCSMHDVDAAFEADCISPLSSHPLTVTPCPPFSLSPLSPLSPLLPPQGRLSESPLHPLPPLPQDRALPHRALQSVPRDGTGNGRSQITDPKTGRLCLRRNRRYTSPDSLTPNSRRRTRRHSQNNS